MALANVANQAVWYCGFLKELGYTIKHAVPLHGDNKGAVDLALNPINPGILTLSTMSFAGT